MPIWASGGRNAEPKGLLFILSHIEGTLTTGAGLHMNPQGAAEDRGTRVGPGTFWEVELYRAEQVRIDDIVGTESAALSSLGRREA